MEGQPQDDLPGTYWDHTGGGFSAVAHWRLELSAGGLALSRAIAVDGVVEAGFEGRNAVW